MDYGILHFLVAMHFVFVSYNYTPGINSPGEWINRIKFYIRPLELVAENHVVTRIEQIDYEGYCLHNNIQYYFRKLKTPRTYFPRRLNQFVKHLNPDIVFVHGTHYPLQILQLRLLLPKSVKIIVQHHAEQPFNGFKKYIQRFASYYIDAYLFAARDLGLVWVKQGNIHSAEKIKEVMEVSSPFYPFKKVIALEKTNATGSPIFLWVGRLNANKDPLLVIKTFLQFVKLKPSARLYMFYHTSELLKEIHALLNNEPDGKAITMMGAIANEALLYWYNSADYFILGSHYEGSGTAVCEAMSCGCIPVITDILSFRALTDNGKCGLLYEPGNNRALLSALQQTDKINVEEKRQACIDYYHSELSSEVIAQKIKHIATE